MTMMIIIMKEEGRDDSYEIYLILINFCMLQILIIGFVHARNTNIKAQNKRPKVSMLALYTA